MSPKKRSTRHAKKYNIYYTDNVEKYRSLLETKKIESADWVERYEQYKEKAFSKAKYIKENYYIVSEKG